MLQTGDYNVSDDCLDVVANINGVEKGFVFPIFVDNLTIRGEGDVNITSDYNPGKEAGGNWNFQDFITIGGSNVTLENLDLKGNPNDYYGGQCNKVIELAGNGKNLTLKDLDLLPIEDEEGKVNSGSIYIDVADAGNTVIDGVTMSSWITAKAVTAENSTVTVKNTVQDFTNNSYAGYSDETYGYAWNPGVSGDKVSLENFTIKVDDKANFVKQISENLKPGTTVELTENITVDEMVYIQTEGVTIKGNGHQITASDAFKMGNHGQVNLFKVQADNVTLDNINLVTTDKNKHTLDVYGAENLTLKDVTLDNTKTIGGAPLINNGSSISVEGKLSLVTGDNSWYGINVDDKNGPASITFEDGSETTFTNNVSEGVEPKAPVYLEVENSKAEDVIRNPENAGLELGDNGQFVPHTHAYGDWQSDEANHWKECACGDKKDTAAHEFKWVIDKEATAQEAGSKHEECKVCGYKKAAVEIPATGTTTTTESTGTTTTDTTTAETTATETTATETTANGTTTTDGSNVEDPETGENAPLLWIVLAAASCGILLVLKVCGGKIKARH